MRSLTPYLNSAAKAFLDVVALVGGRRPRNRSVVGLELLRAEIQTAVPEPSGAHDAWMKYCNQLRRSIADRDPANFLRWKFIRRSMCLTNHPFLLVELRYLRSLPDWTDRWEPALADPWVGNPIPFLFARKTTGNTIHLAYHLAQWERASGCKVNDLSTIVEFGGGFGGMTRLARVLGFNGRYVVYDLPPFTALQRFYISECGIEAETSSEISSLETGHEGDGLFVACFSWSETPLDTRSFIESIARQHRHLLVGYQQRFRGIDNRSYFLNWTESTEHYEIGHTPGSWYLLR